MRSRDVRGRKSLLVEKRLELARFSERRCLREDLAMMRAIFARNQGKQGKHPGVSGSRNESGASEWDPHPRQLRT